MKTSYLEYYKLILDKVSFDSSIWEKEYHKALSNLNKEEAFLLKQWANNKFFRTDRLMTGQAKRQHDGVSLKPSKRKEAI
ncbi:hypothetical protein [Echinicola sp. 20G]|uniref:hypothetical protein n=1 Tax=Echinicola sp. 20G TaxID=2781961 RepID=UPI00190FFCE0|nr:hypothetical protein [Echinicola sp. 20G]